MLDLEKAFETDKYEVFLRAEQDMPEELLEDAYKLFWISIEQKKFRVATFLMRKPYFSPFLSEKPSNWMSMICKMPELLEIACKQHIDKSKINDSDAVSLIKSALKIRYLNKKGIKNLIESFSYEFISTPAKYKCKDLLGRLFCQREWYWARQIIDWGVPIDKHVIKQWAKVGLSIPSKTEGSKAKKVAWPDQEIEPFKKEIILSIYRLGDEIAEEFVINNATNGFLFTLKLFSKNEKKRKSILIATAKSCLIHPKSELSEVAIAKFPNILKAVFKPSEDWIKKASSKKSSLTHLEQFIIENKSHVIQRFAVKIGNLVHETCPKAILKAIQSQPKHISVMVLRHKAEELGLENIVPHISRKEHIEMLLSEDIDPFVLMSLSTKPTHQAYLMERLADL